MQIKPLYHGEGHRRGLVGWVDLDTRTIYTPAMHVSEPIKVPTTFCAYVPVNRQMFVNKAHARRLEALSAYDDT